MKHAAKIASENNEFVTSKNNKGKGECRFKVSQQEVGFEKVSNPCYFIWFRHLFRSRAVTNRIFSLRKDLFSCMGAPHVLSYHLTSVPWLALYV